MHLSLLVCIALICPPFYEFAILQGTLIIDMGTTRVSLTRELAKETAPKGAEFVDAPVSGGQVGAQQGTLE